MFARVMGILAQCVSDLEVYSIDEAFLDFAPLQHRDITVLACEIRAKVKQ